MKRLGFIKLVSIGIIFLTSCIDPYNPPQIELDHSYLVVDGYVDMEAGKASIILSRTKNLSESNALVVQSNAQVSVHVENGSTYQLVEGEAGVYTADGLMLNETDKCMLSIKADGKEYESEFVSIKKTPEIDSVTYVAESSGVRIEVTTHDPANSTWYYAWQYEETGKYLSAFRSNYYYRGPNDYPNRGDDMDIHTCWKSIPSTAILVGTSANLKQDVIYKYPLTFIPSNSPSTSWLLEHRFSILVKQYAMDEDAYNYWMQIKKNTESLGTLFDPQPSQITGNLRCLDVPSEPVLGLFSVRSIREKRIYIKADDLPDYTDIITGYEQCLASELDTLLLEDLAVGIGTSNLLIDAVTEQMGTQIIGYSTHNPVCIDCRLVRKGTLEKPEWWED